MMRSMTGSIVGSALGSKEGLAKNRLRDQEKNSSWDLKLGLYWDQGKRLGSIVGYTLGLNDGSAVEVLARRTDLRSDQS